MYFVDYTLYLLPVDNSALVSPNQKNHTTLVEQGRFWHPIFAMTAMLHYSHAISRRT